jgi:hypothetical protein
MQNGGEYYTLLKTVQYGGEYYTVKKNCAEWRRILYSA